MSDDLYLATHVDDTWCFATAVTADELIHGVLKKGRRDDLVAAINGGTPPREAIKARVPLGNAFRTLTLRDVQTLSWYDDDSYTVSVIAEDERTAKKTHAGVRLDGPDETAEFIDLLTRRTGRRFREETELASIWYAGVPAFAFFGLFTLVYIGIAIAAFDPDPNEVRGRGAFMAGIGDTLGPTGAVVLGIAFVAAFLLTWYFLARRRATRHVLTAEI